MGSTLFFHSRFCQLLLCILLIPVSLYPQVCQGDIELETQAEVNVFACTEITGKLTISGWEITDLSPLLMLKSVGALEIHTGFDLENLDGLDSLNSIDGDLVITHCHGLLEIDALSQLRGELDNLQVYLNDKLTQLDGLAGISKVKGEIDISRNKKLLHLNGLAHVKSCTSFLLHYNSEIENLDSLADMKVLKELVITQNSDLLTVNGFTRTDSLDLLRIINFNVESIHGLQNLRHLNQLILHSTDLKDLSGLKGLRGKISSVEIYAMNNLSSLSGLDSLREIEFLSLEFLKKLPSLHGLGQVETIGELKLEALSLTDLQGLSGLKKIGQILDIIRNEKLSSLKGLDQVSEIGPTYPYSSIRIIRNAVLKDLDGLYGLRGVHRGGIKIWNNDELESINGLDSLSAVRGDISIEDNPKLTLCCSIRPWVQTQVLGRSIRMSGNGEYCNFSMFYPAHADFCKIEAPVDTSTSLPPFEALDTTVHGISPAFPNPHRGTFYVYFSKPDESEMVMEIIDPIGRRILYPMNIPTGLSHGKHKIELQGMAPGTYFIRLSSPLQSKTFKMLIW